jgi:hypothetical protein
VLQLGWRSQSGADAIPAALALSGLEDQRPIPPPTLTQLSYMLDAIHHLLPELPGTGDTRICDLVAARLKACRDHAFINWLPESERDSEHFLRKPLAERDADIARMRTWLTPFVQRKEEEAGLRTKSPTPSDF